MNTPTASTVVVYSFQAYDRPARAFVYVPFKARREDIVDRFGGRVLEGTAQEVALDALDDEGHYRRIPTGWGA